MNAREERLVTENNLWELDAWLDDVDVYAKPHFDYVNSQLVNTGIKFGNNPTRMTAFIGDTIVRHEDGSHTVLSAKDAAELARLRQERHTTNEALDEAVQALRVQRDRIAELEAKPPRVKKCAVCGTTEAAVYYNFRKQNICQPCGTQPMGVANTAPRQPEDPDESIPRFSVSEIARWQARQVEDPHDSPLHHDYAESRDLPIPRQVTGRCPKCNGTFEDCTCGGGS